MIRWVTTGVRIGLVVAAMAVIVPMVTFAQTPESATASEPVVGGDASPVQGASGLEDNTSVETNPPARMAIPAVVESETQRETLNQFAEYITWWAQTVTWWLSATAIFLTLFAVVVAIASFVSFKRFREIEAEARKSVEAAKRYETDAKDHAEHIEALQGESEAYVQRIRGLNAEAVANDPAKANLTVEDVRENPRASLTDKAIANAVDLQRQGRNKEALEKWRAIASIAERIDNNLAARAWFSVGYLVRDESLEDCISANDRAIRLKPDYANAYNNRGNAKGKLERYEAALADFDQAILLKPDHAGAYSNRGVAKYELGRHEGAVADYDEAIRLKPDYAEAYINRSVANQKLGQYEGAVADCNEAIRLKPDLAVAYSNRGAAKAGLDLKDEARKDFEIALELARNTNNANIAAQAEQALRDLDAAEGS